MEIVDLRRSRDGGLLDQVYRDLYLLCFRDPDEQEDLEQYRDRLFAPQRPPPQPITHFLVAGENLEDPHARIVKAMMIFELYRESRCGLLTYLAVAPEGRGQGLGRMLLRHAIDCLSRDCHPPNELRAVFAETHHPAQVDPAADAMSPNDRIQVMRRLGGQQVPVRYVQPELRPGSGRSRQLLLITFPIDQDRPLQLKARVVVDFLDEFYRALGVANPSCDVDYNIMRTDIEQASAISGKESHDNFDSGLLLPIANVLPS